MRAFFLHSITLTLGLVILTLLVLYWGFIGARIEVPMMPREQSAIAWQAVVEPEDGSGASWLKVTEDQELIAYDFFLSSTKKYPYTGYNFIFVDDPGRRTLMDLRRFDSLSFDVTCLPRNILLLVLFTFDDKTTDLNDPQTYRVNWHFFTCNDYWQTEKARLKEFETPDWWLQTSGLELVDRAYDLDKVIGFAVINSLQSPRDMPLSAKLASVTLSGNNRLSISLAIVVVALAWLAFAYWMLQRYVQSVVAQAKARMREDLPLTAYQKLSLSPQKDKARSNLLLFLATDYANPDLNIEFVADKLGINRTKINEILRDELGLTFTAYINKLRLTEAARLLSQHQEETIAQIAYKVGYNNVTYFNKLFKNTYGCTPKRFKDNVGGAEQ